MPRSRRAPPASAGSNSRLLGLNANCWPWSADRLTISPISPASMIWCSAATCGRNRVHIASMTKTPAAFAAAKAAGVFVMEAMWTRFLPHVAALHQIIDAGEIGEIVNLSADHGQQFAFNPKSRLFDPALAGGALLDLGIYPVSFAHDFLGVPDAIHATGALTETGVDGQVSIVLSYGERTHATLSTTLWATTPTTASISGTEGFVTVAGSFYRPTSFRVQRTDGRVWTFDQPGPRGLQFEAAEVARRVAAGETESPRLTWANTVEVMRTLDEVRAQIGLAYPGE